MTVGRKYPAIDILKLYSKGDHEAWNIFLSECERKQDLQKLETVLYGVQAGMDDLAKKNLNTEKINIWFVRLNRSLEIAMQNIIRARNPNPLDDPLNKRDFIHKIGEKRKRDQEFHKHFRKKSF